MSQNCQNGKRLIYLLQVFEDNFNVIFSDDSELTPGESFVHNSPVARPIWAAEWRRSPATTRN